MSHNSDYSVINSFLDTVCGHVRARKLHHDIREELSVHLDELVKENLANGMAEEEAVNLAVSRMGEPYQIGRQLDHAHRPRTDWLTLVLIALLAGVGLLAMYALQSSGTGLARYVNFFDHKIVHLGIGVVLMAILWICDYQKFQKYSEYIFGFGVILLVLGSLSGLSINGKLGYYAFSSFTFYIPTISILLMLTGIAGIKPLKQQNWKGSMLLIAYRGILPLLLLMQLNAFTIFALYSLIFIFYLWLTKRSTWKLITFVSSSMLLMIYVLISNNNMFSRVFGFLNPIEHPNGSDYMITQTLNAIQSAGWWGKGEIPATILYPYSDGLLPSFIHYFGWVAGAAVIVLIVGFMVRIVIASTKIKESYGHLVFASIGALFVLQFIWSVAMVFGYAPVVGISMPIVGYGGTDQIIQLAVIGFLLGIYRRRGMVPVQVS